ncbi:MAG: ATP-grasp fold amidoligase family protein [Microbacteriaceae bacterium]
MGEFQAWMTRRYRQLIPRRVRLWLLMFLTRNPRTFNQKVRYKLARDFRPILTQTADKVAVREYVAERIGAEYLVPLLQCADTVNGIDWEALPREFVLKVSHGSRGNIVFADVAATVARADVPNVGWSGAVLRPDEFNADWASARLDYWLQRTFGEDTLEHHYWSIPPRVMVEQLIVESGNAQERCIASQIMVQTIAEEPFSIVITHPDGHLDHDVQRRFLSNEFDFEGDMFGVDGALVAQACALSRVLAEQFDQVRVDWLAANGQLYFGEMTHAPAAGWNEYRSHPTLGCVELDEI